MSQKIKFSINGIQLTDTNVQSIEDHFHRNGYTDKAGIGIIDCSSDGNVVSATLLKRVPTFINEYNSHIKSYEKRQIFIYQQMQFEIDLFYKLLYIVGTQGSLSIVRGFLKSTLPAGLIISNIETTPYSVYKLLKTGKVKFKVSCISIDHFDYKGATGKFSVMVTERVVANELINTYMDGINKIVFDIQNDDGVFAAHIYPAGVIGIVSEDEFQLNYFEFLKQILFR